MFPTVLHLDAAAMPWREFNVGKPNYVRLKELNRDPETGGHLWLVNEPAGFKGSGGGRPHYLPVDEEALFLSGRMVGDPETTYVAGDYLFFPKGFLHSPDDATDIGAEILMRFSGPMSYVNGELPRGRPWRRDDERQVLPGQTNARTPISRRATADLPWEDWRLEGEPTGERVRLLSTDRTTGACTFIVKIPAGWRSPAGRRMSAAQREWFVLEGDYRTGGPDGVHMKRWGYRCLLPDAAFGGAGEGSDGGATPLCWSSGPLDHMGPAGDTRQATLG